MLLSSIFFLDPSALFFSAEAASLTLFPLVSPSALIAVGVAADPLEAAVADPSSVLVAEVASAVVSSRARLWAFPSSEPSGEAGRLAGWGVDMM